MAGIGYISLLLALIATICSGIACAIGMKKGLTTAVRNARYGTMVVFGLVSLSAAVLIVALITNNFQIEYVSSYSSTDLPLLYRIVALWAGSAGSLLVWAWVLALCALLVVTGKRHRIQELVPSASIVLMLVEVFFLILLVSVSNPFTELATIPSEGMGLNPALMNPAMIIHPPLLLGGYAASAVPFAFLVGGLVTKRMGSEWAAFIRRWALLVWLLIGMGTITGAWWAYVELGWGGYWAWDPMENAGLIPWLVLVAFLHTNPLYERKQMLGVWNALLIISFFLLTIFGTFLTRSGIAHSVHAYAQSGQGPFFVIFMLIILVGSLSLVYFRRRELKSQVKMGSLFSREGLTFITGLLLVVAAYVIFLGTIIPIIAGIIWKTRISIGAEFFNMSSGPIFMLTILLMGICIFTGRRLVAGRRFTITVLPPLIAALVVGIVLFLAGVHNGLALVSFMLCGFSTSTILLAWFLEIKNSGARGANYLKTSWSLFWSQKAHYGVYIVHIAIILIAVGVIGSSFYKIDTKTSLLPGDSTAIGSYTIEYEGVMPSDVPGEIDSTVVVLVYQKGELVDRLTPGIYRVEKSGRMYAEVAIHSTPAEDLYVILTGVEESNKASFTISVNPLVMWLWIGAFILLLGGLLCFSTKDNVTEC